MKLEVYESILKTKKAKNELVKIKRFIEYFEKAKGRKPEKVSITKDQYKTLFSSIENPPPDLEGFTVERINLKEI